MHFVRYLQEHHRFPDEVELFDGGTLGLMATHMFEDAERVYIVDALAVPGTPGECHRYAKEDFLLRRIPVKLSPHQAGVQEMLMVSEMRGCCPEEVHLLGVIPGSFEPGIELSPPLQDTLKDLAGQLVAELRAAGVAVE